MKIKRTKCEILNNKKASHKDLLFYFKISHFVRLIFIVAYARLLFKEMRISRCGLPPTKEEVRRMIEFQGLLFISYLLFAGLVSVAIITFALIIALVIIISKQK